jgi:hypothetical protein
MVYFIIIIGLGTAIFVFRQFSEEKQPSISDIVIVSEY